MRAIVVGIVSGVLLLTPPVSAASCKISQSVYRDAEGHGFELVFGDSLPGVGGSRATATIRHSTQGQLYHFNVTQANGYGSISLLTINATSNGLEFRDGFGIYFFDQELKSAMGILGREQQAPQYAFIPGLGSHDYYRRRMTNTNESTLFLSDTMWIHDRCQ